MTMTDILSDDDGQGVAGAWLELRPAQQRLGVSERTLHRRVAAGKLRKRTRANGRLEVFVPSDASGDGPTTTDEKTDIDGQAARAEHQLALIDRFSQTIQGLVEPLQADLRLARDQVERLSRENGELSERNRQLQTRLEELEARLSVTDKLSGVVGRSVEPEQGPATSTPAPEAVPWWRRLLRGPR